MRNTFAVVLGAMVAFAVVSIFDAIAGSMFSLPPGLDAGNQEAVTAAIEAAIRNAPLRAILTIVTGYFVAAACGGFIAGKISSAPSNRASIIVGMLVLFATILNFTRIAHPTLMVVLGVLAPIPGALLGARLSGVRSLGNGRR